MENHTIRKKENQRTRFSRINPSTIIVGAGWAGLACAIKLTQAKHQVTLIEATPYLGGRARTITVANNLLDNGQHVLMGAYTETLKLLQSIGILPRSVFTRIPFGLKLHGNNINIDVTLPTLPAPLHVLAGLIMTNGLTNKEKLNLIKLSIQLHKTNFTLAKDCSILTALQTLGQSDFLITNLWEPIALATMSTPISLASANVFFQVLHDTFTGNQSNSDWLLPKKDLSKILPNPAAKYLLANDATIILRQPIKDLIYENSKCIGVTNEQNSWYADHIVLATPLATTAKLLANDGSSLLIANNLSKITSNTITTIYLMFADPVCLSDPIIGLLDQPVQWIFDRKITMQPNILTAVITHNNNTPEYTYDELISAVITQLRKHFSNLPKLTNVKIIQEKRAAFLCTPEMQQLRPTHTTGSTNLLLAGDYTASNYPATIEGAIRSGVRCAKLLE